MPTEPIVNSQSSLVNILVSLDPGATLPTRAHDTDVGYDVTSISLAVVHPNGAKTICTSEEQIRDLLCNSFHYDKYEPSYYEIDTGVHVKPAPGYYCELVPNSRQAKTTVSWNNSIGIIDPGYTGSIKIITRHAQPSDLAKYLPGNVVGQLIIRPQLHANFTQVPHLPETDRGNGGFGSTANH